MDVFNPLLVTGRTGDDMVLEGVAFFRAEVLDDITPLALGFIGRTPEEFTNCSALFAKTKKKR